MSRKSVVGPLSAYDVLTVVAVFLGLIALVLYWAEGPSGMATRYYIGWTVTGPTYTIVMILSIVSAVPVTYHGYERLREGAKLVAAIILFKILWDFISIVFQSSSLRFRMGFIPALFMCGLLFYVVGKRYADERDTERTDTETTGYRRINED